MTAYHCASGRQCVWWVEKVMEECVCGTRDYVSFVFGLISLFSWADAEVPQIITNFNSGCTEGVSLGFLMAWVVGDLFNLIGCWLEPATLPTQFYAALPYTITTIVLVFQIIDYDHIYNWWKARTTICKLKRRNSGSDLYYTSARSFTRSHTPTPGSYFLHHSCGPRLLDNLSVGEEGLLTNLISPSPNKSTTILPSIAPTILFLTALHYFNLPSYNNITSASSSSQTPRTYAFMITERRLLQRKRGGEFNLVVAEESSSPLGTWLGWLMASIYMGGRLPQICLNIKRGTVEGLNPLMFLFALIGNATYVRSILVLTLEWEKLKPNVPWLIDAAACVLLDFFILVQFIYYKLRRTSTAGVGK